MLLTVSYVTAYSAQVFEGHPFVVEAGVSVGGKDVKQVSAILLIDHQCINSSHVLSAID